MIQRNSKCEEWSKTINKLPKDDSSDHVEDNGFYATPISESTSRIQAIYNYITFSFILDRKRSFLAKKIVAYYHNHFEDTVELEVKNEKDLMKVKMSPLQRDMIFIFVFWHVKDNDYHDHMILCEYDLV